MIERTITVVPEAGLHARPAAALTTAANEHDAEVTIATEDGEFVPANSMLAVTGLNVRQGESLRVRADGRDEKAAVEAIAELLETPVEEDGDETGSGDGEPDRGNEDDPTNESR